MDHPVTHCVDLLHGGDDAVLRVHQGVQHGLDGLGMGGHGHVAGVYGGLPRGLIGEFAVDADALAKALGQHVLAAGVQQLVFQGRAAGVDDENFHVPHSFSHDFQRWGWDITGYLLCPAFRRIITKGMAG